MCSVLQTYLALFQEEKNNKQQKQKGAGWLATVEESTHILNFKRREKALFFFSFLIQCRTAANTAPHTNTVIVCDSGRPYSFP